MKKYKLFLCILLLFSLISFWKIAIAEDTSDAAEELEESLTTSEEEGFDDISNLEESIEEDESEESASDESNEIESVSAEKKNDSLSEKTEEPLEEIEKAVSSRPAEESPARQESALVEKESEARVEESSPPTSPIVISNEKNTIRNLEFKMEGDISKIVVTSQFPLQYRESRNSQVSQVVYYFENTETSQKLQRAYDTTEFRSPVSLFTLLQMPQSNPPQTKLIVQLRDDKVPTVTSNEKGIVIEFPPFDKKEEDRFVIGGTDERVATEDNIYSGSRIFTGQMLKRLEVKNSDIHDVLRLIAKTSGYNIVIGDEVQGNVGTLSLENVPWDQVFALILQSKRLGYVRQGNVLRVSTLLALKSEKDESLANEIAKQRLESIRTVLIPVNYAKAGDISARAKSFITDRGSLDVDTRTNTLIVRDIDSSVTKVQKLLAALDTQPPRVSITAKVVEIKKSFSRGIGFSFMRVRPDLGGINIDQTFGYQTTGAHTTKLTAAQFSNLEAQFKLGEIDQEVKTLANPSVAVVANQQASIQQSLSFFVITSDAVAGGQVIPGVRQISANLTLDVTPIVSGDGTIFLTTNVRNEIPNGIPPALTIDSRSISTQVLVEDGDTAVLGGVFQNLVDESRSGVPFLMRVPILGFFFSGTDFKDNKNEIFIFITAKILNPEEAFRRG